ncbi:hypothetical protein [Dactylosporangium sp. CA-092794]|uniref:hypothetical protein n=1 Tax=Dactylosporangium sp. CA-092794 TaxID=3239929 RepID=UPI003D8CF401
MSDGPHHTNPVIAGFHPGPAGCRTTSRRPGRAMARTLEHRWPDVLAAVVCLAAVPLVHRPGPALHAPYWLDEAWVALAAGAPGRDLWWVGASSPPGWTALIWALPARGQADRLLVLVFLALSVLAGYAFGRSLRWPDRRTAVAAGLCTAAGVLLVPAQVLRHDLKPYTAEAAVALLLLMLGARAEATWSRGRLAGLAAALVPGTLLSHTAVFAGAAVFGGLALVPAVTRRWRRLRDVLIAGLGAGLGAAAVVGFADRTGRTAALDEYWAGYFPPVGELPRYLVMRLDELEPALGAPWPVFVVLAVLGVAALARLGRPGSAVALVLLPLVAAGAGVARLYPLLDQRTSHFLLVCGAAAAALGLFAAVRAAARRFPPAVTAGMPALALAGYAFANRGVLLHPPPPGNAAEDVRSQTAYVAAHRAPGDVVLVNLSGQYGFAYYWPLGRPEFVRGGEMATGWHVAYPPGERIVICDDRDPAAVSRCVAEADRLAAGGRIWLVRSHVNPAEARAWEAALRGRRVQDIPVGVEPLGVLTG